MLSSPPTAPIRYSICRAAVRRERLRRSPQQWNLPSQHVRRRLSSTGTAAPPDPSTSSAAAAEPVSPALAGKPDAAFPKLPFRFETGIGLFAKRQPRPFPPPFLSPPSGSFSDPLSTHHKSRVFVNGELIRGRTNGDDAVFASDYFVCANDGVGAWSQRPRGHAGLWSRLILHFWAAEVYRDMLRNRGGDRPYYEPDPVQYLQRAYEETLKATAEPNDWQGTTTATGAQLHFRPAAGGTTDSGPKEQQPVLYVTNLGDSQVMVVRPRDRSVVYKTQEQWHWFDCPRQLGTNSPDTPRANAVVDVVAIEPGDVVLAMSDGVIDNLWEHEIVSKVADSIERWEAGEGGESAAVTPAHGTGDDGSINAGGAGWAARAGGANGGMNFVAGELMRAAKEIAVDPFAESPFMEHALEEGLASPGGKLDDISVVAALCRKTDK